MSDTDGGDSYFFLLTVFTGMRKGAGTLSNVNFILSGDEADTGIRSLKDGVRKVCESYLLFSYLFSLKIFTFT